MEQLNEYETNQVPLSNREVLEVLRVRNNTEHSKRTLEMKEYLESIIIIPYKYPLDILRDLKNSKNLEADLNTLAILSNTSDLSILNNSDKKIIEKHFQNKKNHN